MQSSSMLIESVWCLDSIRDSLIVGVTTGIEAFCNQMAGTDNRKHTEALRAPLPLKDLFVPRAYSAHADISLLQSVEYA